MSEGNAVPRRRLLQLGLAAATAGVAGCTRGPRSDREVLYAGAFSLAKSVDEALWFDFEANIERARPDIDVRLLIRGETGPEEQTFASLRRGRVQVAGGSFAGVATLVPEIALLSVPFLFDSEEEVDFVMDRWMLEPFRELFAAKGLRLIQWTEVGWVNLYGKQPLQRPADLRSRRIRASSSIASQAFIGEVGADTITLPFSDVVPSLQTGLIEGGVTSLTMYSLSGIATEAPHYTLTRHSYDMGVLLANAEWFAGLEPDASAAVESGFGGAASARRRARSAVAELAAALPSKGVTLHTQDPATREEWRRAAWPAHQKLVRRVGGEAERIYAQMTAGIAAYRAEHPPGAGRV